MSIHLLMKMQGYLANECMLSFRGYRSKREAMGLNLQIPAAMQQQQQNGAKDDKSKGNDVTEASNDIQHNKNSPLSPDTRWNDALSSGGLQRMNSEQLQNKNDAKSRWQRTGFYAERITGYDGRGSGGGGSKKGEQEDGADQSAGAKAAAIAPNKQMWAWFHVTIRLLGNYLRRTDDKDCFFILP